MKVAVQISLLLLGGVLAAPGIAGEADYRHAVGGGATIGAGLDNDSTMWGWSLDYSRLLESGRTFGITVAFDEETERLKGKADKVVKTYSTSPVWTYPVSNRWSLGGGFGKDLLDDDNRDGDYKTVDWDSGWTAGATAVYNLLSRDRHSLSASTIVDYNFSDNNSQITFDLIYAWSF